MTDTNPKYKGDKHNKGKMILGAIEPSFIDGLGRVLTYGAAEYDRDNWKKGLPENETIDALLRHINKFRLGEKCDKSSGIDHRYHAICNLMFWLGLYP